MVMRLALKPTPFTYMHTYVHEHFYYFLPPRIMKRRTDGQKCVLSAAAVSGNEKIQ
jgi:hydroxymethylpyrimidine/phosphomethylpyrimidine kinase